MNETLQTIFQRHSTRAFQKKQVADDVLEQILKAGVAAPSANNSQNWIFTAVQKPELLQRLCKAVPGNYAERRELLLFLRRAHIGFGIVPQRLRSGTARLRRCNGKYVPGSPIAGGFHLLDQSVAWAMRSSRNPGCAAGVRNSRRA